MKTQNKSAIIHHLIFSIYWSRNLSHNSITAQAAIINNLATYMFTTRKQEVHLIASLNLFFHRNYTLKENPLCLKMASMYLYTPLNMCRSMHLWICKLFFASVSTVPPPGAYLLTSDSAETIWKYAVGSYIIGAL